MCPCIHRSAFRTNYNKKNDKNNTTYLTTATATNDTAHHCRGESHRFTGHQRV